MNTDFRQSPGYQQLLRKGGCITEDLGSGEAGYVTRLRVFPFLSFMVIQRVEDPKALAAAEKLSRRYHSLFVKVAPRVVKGSGQAEQWEKELRAHGFRWDKSAIAPTKTVIVDLELSEDELLMQMKPKTRYNIRLSQRRGVTTKVADGVEVMANANYFEDFYTVYRQNCQRIGMRIPPRKFMENFFKTFGQNLFVVLTYAASGEPAAVASFVVSVDTVSYQMNGSTEKGRHDFATNLTVWEGMREGKRRGCRWFDFDGIYDERYEEDEDWKGFSRFKLSFGGQEVTYLGSYIKRLPFLKK